MELKENERIDELGINNLKIIQNKKYFCFGTDSVLLANFVKSDSSKNVIVDLCSGSGVIPVILSAKKKYSKIYSVELQSEMFKLLERNIQINNLSEKIVPLNCDIKDIKKIKDMVLSQTKSEKIDIIVCNPPYKTLGTGFKTLHDVKTIAKCEVMCNLEDVFNTSSKLLSKKGKMYLVHKPERLADLISLGRKYKLELKEIRFVYPTINKKASIILACFVKDGGNEVSILPPLIEYNEDNSYTDAMNSIYLNNYK